jgi:hypothetical protein
LNSLGETRVGQEHQELVPTDAPDVIRGPQRILDAIGELLEHHVPDPVSLGLVDPLEVVAVEQHGRQRRARAALALHFDRELGLQPSAIGDLGQGIDAGESLEARVQFAHPRGDVLEVRLGALVLGDVEHRRETGGLIVPADLDTVRLDDAFRADLELHSRLRPEGIAEHPAAQLLGRTLEEPGRGRVGEQHRAVASEDHDTIGAVREHLAKPGFLLRERLQLALELALDSMAFERQPDRLLERGVVRALLDEVVAGPFLHRAQGHVFVIDVGHHDDRHVGRRLADLDHRVDPAGVGEIQVEQNDVGLAVAQASQRRVQRRNVLDVEVTRPAVAQPLLDQGGVGGVVLDEQCADRAHGHLLKTWPHGKGGPARCALPEVAAAERANLCAALATRCAITTLLTGV